jgi:hypothetical protein
MAVLGINNLISTDDAVNLIGCRYTQLHHLIKTKKIKAQKIQNRWMIDMDDANRVREQFIPRGKKLDTAPKETKEHFVSIKIDIPRDTYNLVNLVLQKHEKTLPAFLNERVSELCSRVQAAVKDLSL